MNVSLSAELERLIEQKVKSGMYNSASEVIRAGLRLLQERRYQMVILDLKLPGLNGYEVLKSISKKASPPKVLVLSGRPLGEPLLKVEGVSQDEEERFLKLAAFVINKPFMVENFVQKVRELAPPIVEKSQ